MPVILSSKEEIIWLNRDIEDLEQLWSLLSRLKRIVCDRLTDHFIGGYMKINMTDAAVAWLKEEIGLKTGDYLRFFARYGGCGNAQTGFSLGISKESPHVIGEAVTVEGITFFMEKEDLWYLQDKDLVVTVKDGELTFDYRG
jgi:uncharacterized protein YneR